MSFLTFLFQFFTDLWTKVYLFRCSFAILIQSSFLSMDYSVIFNLINVKNIWVLYPIFLTYSYVFSNSSLQFTIAA